MKLTKKILLVLLLFSTLLVSGILAACNSGSDKTENEVVPLDRTIAKFSVPETATCGAGSYYIPEEHNAVDSYGMKQESRVLVYDENKTQVTLDDKNGFNISQKIGSYYSIIYKASVDNDTVSKLKKVYVVDDSAAPVIVTDGTVLVSGGDNFVISNYYTVTDDSGVKPAVEYKAKYNGEEFEFAGDAFFVNDDGVYEFSLRATDGSGNASEWSDLTVVVREPYVFANFEIESDVDTGNSNGIRVSGDYGISISDEIKHSGGHSLKWVKADGNEKSELFVTKGLDAETNGPNFKKSYSYFGFWVYFMPKDSSGKIRINYTSTPYDPGYWWENALMNMGFYVDGKEADFGRCNGTRTVELPTEKWVYVIGEIVEYANTAFTFTPSGYEDNSFTAYVDDFAQAHYAESKLDEAELNYFNENGVTLELSKTLGATLKELYSNAGKTEPTYEPVKINSDGTETAIPVVNGKCTLTEGNYRIYYKGVNGCRAGLYASVKVRDTFRDLLQFDADGNDIDNLPAGLVGREYKIPTVKSQNQISVATEVEFNDAEVQSDSDKFVPAETGTYTIRYKITMSGRSEEFEFSADVLTELPDGALTTDFDSVEKTQSGQVGDEIKIPDLVVSGGSGKIGTEVKVTCNDKDVTVIDGTFVPETAGTYKVTYTVRDYLSVITESFDIVIEYDGQVIFGNFPKLPSRLISGYKYTASLPDAYKYVSGERKDLNCESYWEYKDQRTKFVGEFTPVVENNGDTVNIIFVADGEEKAIRNIPVILPSTTGGNLDPSVYFICDGDMTASSGDSYTYLSGMTGASAQYFLPLTVNPWQFVFGVDAVNKNGAFTVSLVSCKDKTKVITMKFAPAEEGSYITVNGNEPVKTGVSFGDETNRFSLRYIGANAILIDQVSNSVIANLSNEMSGFGNDGAYMRITFDNTDGTFGLKCYNLNMQVLKIVESDELVPSMQFDRDLPLIYTEGDVVTVPSVTAFDVFDPNVSAYVTVVKIGSDGYVTGDDGTVLNRVNAGKDYRFSAESGQYIITYEVADAAGNKGGKPYTLKVYKSDTKPSIEINGKMPTDIKAGNALALPDIKAYDCYGNGIDVKIYICDPYETVSLYSEGYKPTEKGRYEIYVYAVDSDGWLATYRTVLTVE